MRKFLIVIDMQNDFVTGSLGSENAQAIVPEIAKLIQDLKPADELFFTRDTHGIDYSNTLEGRKLPVVHCVNGTYGHQIVRDLLGYRDASIINKKTFGSTTLVERLSTYVSDVDEIHIVGVCTDICVISNALALRMVKPNTKIVVHKDLCAGTSVESHDAAMTVMESCQIDIVEGVGMYD